MITKLMKYQFKQKQWFYLWFITITILFSLWLYFNIGNIISLFISLNLSLLAIYVYNIIIYGKDFSKNGGYLLFSTTIKGKHLIISRIFSMLIDGIFVLVIFTLLDMFINIFISGKNDFYIVHMILEIVSKKQYFVPAILFTLSVFSLTVYVFFCITFFNTQIKSISGKWLKPFIIILFILLPELLSRITHFVSNPIKFDIDITSYTPQNASSYDLVFMNNVNFQSFSITECIIGISIYIALFWITCKMIDKRLNI